MVRTQVPSRGHEVKKTEDVTWCLLLVACFEEGDGKVRMGERGKGKGGRAGGKRLRVKKALEAREAIVALALGSRI